MKVEMSDKKQHIYLEATRLFMERGYPATSMRDLATTVGLEPSSLYSHIKSKEEILRTICFNCARQFLDGIDNIELSSLTSRGKIRELIALHVEIAVDDPSSITVFSDEWKHLSEPYLSDFLNLRRTYEKKFLNILREGIESGELIDIDPVMLMNSLISSTRWIHWKHQQHFSKAACIQTLSDLFLKGLMQR